MLNYSNDKVNELSKRIWNVYLLTSLDINKVSIIIRDNEMIKKACNVELKKEIKYHVTISTLADYT